MKSYDYPFFGKAHPPEGPASYAINLAWINQSLNPEQTYAFPCDSKEELINQYLDKALKWKRANQEAVVNFWYDSHFTSAKALANTIEILKSDERFSQIELRDIRDIDIVKRNPDSFSDMVPVYVRVDLIKLILCVFSIENDSMDAATFSDLDVGELRPNKDRMSKTELFNPEIMKKLIEFGLELGADASGKTENQFIQIFNKPETLIAIKITIDAALLRVITVLNMARKRGKGYLCHLSSGAVFLSLTQETPALIGSQLAKDDANKMKINLQVFDWERNEEWVTYDPLTHGCIPLGNAYLGAHAFKFVFILEQNDQFIVKKLESAVKFPVDSSIYELGRRDIDSRTGRSHGGLADRTLLDHLIDRDPANGQRYECEFLLPPTFYKTSGFESLY